MVDFAQIGAALNSMNNTLDQGSQRTYNNLRARQALQDYMLNQQSNAAFGSTALDVLARGGAPGGLPGGAPNTMPMPGAAPGPSPLQPAPGGGAGPMPQPGPQQAPMGAAPQQGPQPGAMPGQGAPQQGGQTGPNGQLTWQMVAQALQKKGITNPQVIAQVIDRYMPLINDQSKLQWQYMRSQIAYMDAQTKAAQTPIRQQVADAATQNAATKQQLVSGELPIMQQKADAATTTAGASASRAATAAATEPVKAQAAATRAGASVLQAQKARDWRDPAQRPQIRPAAAAALSGSDKVKLQQLMHADQVAAQNYRTLLNVKMTDQDPAVQAAKEVMQHTGEALQNFKPAGSAPAAAAAQQGFQLPAGAPDATGQPDGATLVGPDGNPVAKAQGGQWVAP